MAVDLSGVREAVEGISNKFGRLRAAIDALQSAADDGGLQDEVDAIKARLEGVSEELDAIIADAEGEEETTEPPTEEQPPTATTLPA